MKILEKLMAALKTSGRKQAAFDFRRDVFDWRKVPSDGMTVLQRSST